MGSSRTGGIRYNSQDRSHGANVNRAGDIDTVVPCVSAAEQKPRFREFRVFSLKKKYIFYPCSKITGSDIPKSNATGRGPSCASALGATNGDWILIRPKKEKFSFPCSDGSEPVLGSCRK